MRQQINRVTFKNVMLALIAVTLMLPILTITPKAFAQTCTTGTNPATTYGQVKQTVSIAQSGTYRVWSRIKASSASNNSYFFQVDAGSCAIVVGDSTDIPQGTWTWVNYKNAVKTSYMDLNLTQGSHTLIYTGREADVQLDRVLLLGDLTCVPQPQGKGDDCVGSSDLAPPTASVSSPVNNAQITKGTAVTLSANAQDNVAVTKVEFLVDNVVVGTKQGQPPYSVSWATTSAALGNHSIRARAWDAAGHSMTSAAITVSLVSTDTPPVVAVTAPQNNVTVNVGTAVNVTVTATDNTSVSKVEILVDNVVKKTLTAGPYTYSWPTTGVTSGAHTISARAYDPGNRKGESNAVTVNIKNPNEVVVGDVDGDKAVNVNDYTALKINYGKPFPAGDFNKSGAIDSTDFGVIYSNWKW